MKTIVGAAVIAAAALVAGNAQSATIIAPVAVTIDIGGEATAGTRAVKMIDQSGLDKLYIPGVTDFDAYIASNPIHSPGPNTDWFGRSNGTPNGDTARITFDFGREVTLSRLAYWDEDATRVGRLVMSTPALGAFREFDPIDLPRNNLYAQVLAFRPITTRYLTFDLSGCNDPASLFNACAIGEVAFAEIPAGAVPEPATWAMMIMGFGAAGAVLRRRQHAMARAA